MIHALHEVRRDITLDEARRKLGQDGASVVVSKLHSFFARYGITRKKTGHAIKQDRADVLSQREAGSTGNSILTCTARVIDETWTATNTPAATSAADEASGCG